LPAALGKSAIQAPFMMPERLASQDAFKPLSEVIGSGPFRFAADERVQGARNVYARFDRYQPRQGGKSDWTAGPKIVHYDRVVWTTMPDAATGVAALQTGEQDWQETTPHDLLPVLKRAGRVATRILDPRGYACMLRVNHLQPPFDNPAIRRALLGAIDQSAFMTAVAGDDPAYQSSPIGFFAPGTPMASDVGLDVFRGPRDMAKVKADLKAAGYNGEQVVLLVPVNSLAQKPLGDVAADMLRQAGMNVEYAGLDFGAVLQRQLKKHPIGEGGGAPASAIGKASIGSIRLPIRICAETAKLPGGTRARRSGCCEANGSPPPVLPSNNVSVVISRRWRSKRFLTSRSANTSSRPHTARASPVSSTVLRSFGMCARHEHDRDLRQLCVVAQGWCAGGAARSLGIAGGQADRRRDARPAIRH
jgi:hypothetical protein